MSTSDDDLGLLAAGFTAMLGFQVVPPQRTEQGQQNVRQEAATSFLNSLVGGIGTISLEGATSRPTRPKIGIYELFRTTYQPFQPSLPPQTKSGVMLESAGTDVLHINVKMINGGTTTVRTRKGQTVKEVKADIARQLNIPQVQKLTHFGQSLSDSQPIDMYMPVPPQTGVQYESRMLLPPPGVPMFMPGPPALGGGAPVMFCCAGGEEPYELDCSELDPHYDYDFTNEKDDNRKYIRGGKEYQRPYGWKRFAVKVLDKYDDEDNTWLGAAGLRTEETDGEWPVSYHGSGSRKAVDGILDKGYKIGSGNLYGDGVYTSPSIKWYGEKDNSYTAKFKYKGDWWMVILQNRVNPAEGHLKIQEKTWAKVPFWISPKQDIDKKVFDVRPYGVLFKKM